MKHHEPAPLTNEKLSKEHTNPFELINTAIERAHHMLDRDRNCMVPTLVQNRAYQVLLEMRSGINAIEEWVEEEPQEESSES